MEGARQSGKTTLAKELSGADAIYYTLDDITLLKSALDDPHGFVSHGKGAMIIDEIQRAPILLQAIKKDVDENQEPGRFFLTGSADIGLLPGVTESLAGRIMKIRLRPLALGEIDGHLPHFLTHAFQGQFSFFKHQLQTGAVLNKDDYIQEALKGGYPEARRLGEKMSRRWHKDYLDALMDRDLKDIANIKRHDSMRKLIEVLAAWSSKLMDVSAIGSQLALARPTLDSYINALETLYLVERVPAWSKTDFNRVGKQDKFFMSDTGLMASILRWRLEDIRLDGERHGKLLETLVFTQLAAQIDAQEEDYHLYHYRDRDKREIDFIVENENGDLLGIEVKAGSSISHDHFKHLKWFKEHSAKDQAFTGIVLYTGEHIVPFGEQMWAVPMRVLWL